MKVKEIQEAATAKDFVELKVLFQSDTMFQQLMKEISENRRYFEMLTLTEAINEITGWLYRTNVSCKVSGLVSESAVKAFAVFIILDSCNLTLQKTRGGV